MFKNITMLLLSVVLALSAVHSIAFGPGAEHAQMQNNMQEMQQNKQRIHQHQQMMQQQKIRQQTDRPDNW